MIQKYSPADPAGFKQVLVKIPGAAKLIPCLKRHILPILFISFLSAAQAAASTPDINALSNLSYPLEGAPNGTVTLKDGSFSAPLIKGSAARFEARLLGPAVTASWNGREVAAVVLFYSEGGSGNFRRLFFLTKDKDVWKPRAWTDLGDRIKIKYMGLENHGQIVVGMVTHAPEDPMCCPSHKIVRIYAVKGKKLLPVKTSPAELFPDQVIFSKDILKEGIRAVLVPEHGFSAHGISRIPPYPSHVALVMNGKKAVRIFPAEAYKRMWLAGNDLTIQIAVKRIERLIEKRERDLTPPLPILPPQPGINDLAARPELIQLGNGAGTGFIGRITKTLSCVSPQELRYYFSGLADGERYVVSFVHDISIKNAPERLWSCSRNVEGLKEQISRVSQALGEMDGSNFEPSIAEIKAFLASIKITDR